MLRIKLLADKVFNLTPEVRIAFALHVIRSNFAVEPRHAFTAGGILLIVEAVVAEDLRLGVVGSPNFLASVQNSMRLIKISGLDDIVGNDAIMLPRLGDGVDLDGEKDGDVVAIELASEHYDGGASPTLAEQDDPGRRFFVRAQGTVMVFVDQVDNAAVGRPAVTILKDLNVCIFRGGLSNAFRYEYRSMMGIIVPDEAAHKTYKNVRRGLR